MHDSSWTYYLILAFSLAYPLAQSFEKRLTMWKRFPYLFPGILLTALPFIAWDSAFAKSGIWGFNPNYTRFFSIGGLPLEEILFFLFIPYACFFIYEVLRHFIKNFYYPKTSKWILFGLIVLLTLLLPFTWELHYTRTAILFVLPFLFLQVITRSYRSWFSGFILMYLVSLIPFILVNGLLTSLPVVWYNNYENLGLRLGTIPLEDLIYLLGILLPAMSLYQYLLTKFGSSRLQSGKTSGF